MGVASALLALFLYALGAMPHELGTVHAAERDGVLRGEIHHLYFGHEHTEANLASSRPTSAPASHQGEACLLCANGHAGKLSAKTAAHADLAATLSRPSGPSAVDVLPGELLAAPHASRAPPLA